MFTTALGFALKFSALLPPLSRLAGAASKWAPEMAPSQSSNPGTAFPAKHMAAFLTLLLIMKLLTLGTSGHAQNESPGKGLCKFNPSHYYRQHNGFIFLFDFRACAWLFNLFIFTWKNQMNLTLENKQPLMPSIPELTNSSMSLGECEQLTTPHSWGAKHLITKPNVFTEVVSLFKLMVRSITGRAAHQPLDKPCTEFPAAPFPSQHSNQFHW